MTTRFVIRLTYTCPFEEIEELSAAHGDYQSAYFADGRLLVSGPGVSRRDSIILARMQSPAEIWAFIKGDPFYINRCATYDVTEFEPRRQWTELNRILGVVSVSA